MKNFKRFLKTHILPSQANSYSEFYYLQSKINYGLSRAAATIPLRVIDDKIPNSWEFSGFSQNGEDGIIDYLLAKLKSNNRYFIEIGSSNGLENNTAWLAFAKNYTGLMVEGNLKEFNVAKQILPWYTNCLNLFVTKSNIQSLMSNVLYKDPDLLSLDIDGMDFYIIQELLNQGLKPKIMVLEYNSAFGPNKEITIPYKENFVAINEHSTKLYYGISIEAWRKFLIDLNYNFVTVDLNGVNAFFIHNDYFDTSFINSLKGRKFEENAYQFRKFKTTWEFQFKLISDMPFVEL